VTRTAGAALPYIVPLLLLLLLHYPRTSTITTCVAAAAAVVVTPWSSRCILITPAISTVDFSFIL
jgi:hypothetical protein